VHVDIDSLPALVVPEIRHRSSVYKVYRTKLIRKFKDEAGRPVAMVPFGKLKYVYLYSD
jgi:hypothetical protein